MAASPRFKVFDRDDVYQASAKTTRVAIAAALGLGTGATVRDGYKQKQTIFTVPSNEHEPPWTTFQLAGWAEQAEIEADNKRLVIYS